MTRSALSSIEGWLSAIAGRGALVALMVVAVAAVAVACTSEADSSGDESEASAPSTLTVYSGRSSSLVDPILQEFSTLTGIPIEVRYGSTGEMAGTLLEEGDNSDRKSVV